MRVIEELARLPCKTCGGDTATEPVKGVRHLGTCPDCQEDGKPTGLAFPQLTKPCPGPTESWVDDDYELEDSYRTLSVTVVKDYPCPGKECPVCGGTGRVLKSDAECLLALLQLATAKHHVELGGRVSWYCVLTPRHGEVNEGEGTTPLEALATAIREV